ncbi:hypothetical protein D9M72_461930 [compost metagenome]
MPFYVDPSTSNGALQIKGEAFATNSGTFPANVSVLSNNRWEASVVLGNSNFLNANVRITDASIVSNSKMLKAVTATGEYAVFSPVSIPSSGSLTTYSPIMAADFTGYFSHGQIICTGTVLAPTGTAIQDFVTGQTLADFVVNGTDIIWYDAEIGGNILPLSTLIVSGVTYYASQTVNGCESSTKLAVTGGINLQREDFESIAFKYFPNPVENRLNVTSSENIESVEIYNFLGQKVFYATFNAMEGEVDFSSLSKGTYILRAKIGELAKNVKIVKK